MEVITVFSPGMAAAVTRLSAHSLHVQRVGHMGCIREGGAHVLHVQRVGHTSCICSNRTTIGYETTPPPLHLLYEEALVHFPKRSTLCSTHNTLHFPSCQASHMELLILIMYV